MDTTVSPFEVDRRRGVLYLTLDTPRCDVNIFSNDAATQLRDVLRSIDPQETQAVVLRSGKPDSFINGVGLLMAVAVKSPEGAGELTRNVRATYHALRDCPVTTVAAIEGNCYGCGVELSLFCDHRIAADTAVTHFYMTEIADYLFLPIFEGTLRLPLLLGLEAAADFMLWGERWSARRAHERGLLDAVFESRDFAAATEKFVEDALRQTGGGKPPPRRPADASRTPEEIAARAAAIRARIQSLPPAYHQVYEQGLDLMIRATREGRVSEPDARLEIERSGVTSCAPMAKRALSFFFIRQSVHQRCLGQVKVPPRELTVSFAGEGRAVRDWREVLATRKLPDVELLAPGDTPPASAADRQLCFVGPTLPARAASGGHAIAVGLRAPPSHDVWPAATLLYGPSGGAAPLVEIAVGDEIQTGDRRLYRYLTRAGFRAFFSRPRQQFVTQQALAAYFTPLVRYLQEGGSAAAVDATLRDFGLVRRPAAMLRQLDAEQLSQSLVDMGVGAPASVWKAIDELGRVRGPAGAADEPLLGAFLVSLAAAARRWQDEGILSHAGLVDLVAREALDFPLQHGSLLTYLTRTRLRELSERAAHLRAYLAPHDIAVVEQSAQSERQAYL